MVNTLSAKTLRDKYRSSQVQLALMNNLVAEKVCLVDRDENLYTISSPYLSTSVTATVQAMIGTYTPAAVTTLTDTLTVADEIVAPTHIFDFEAATSAFDLFYMAHQAIANAMVQAIDKWVINELCEQGTEVSITGGGLTTAGNVITIISKIISYCSGYADPIGGFYLIVENSDLVGILPAAVSYGFNFADKVLENGRVAQIMGVDIYVVRDSTFVDATTTAASGSKTWTNASHRVGGVKNVSTYATPRGLKFEEKDRTGFTGKEVVGIGYVGFKQWTPWAGLTMDIIFS